jgi:hypothetical protein
MEDYHFFRFSGSVEAEIPEFSVELDFEDVPNLSCWLEEMTSFGDELCAVLSIDRQRSDTF